VVVADHLGGVAEPPAGGGQVEGEQFRFAADAETRLVTADRQKRLPPDDRRAGHEAQERPAGYAEFGRQRAVF
jgi:hypothetical protein